jgi:hypothetical protein
MSRKDRRGASARLRASNKRGSDDSGVRAELEKLKASHNSLAQAFNTNTESFLQSMTGMDALVWVVRTAFNDMLNGSVKTVDHDGRKQVDLEGYLGQYKQVIEAEAAERKAAPHENGNAEPPIVFGG